jgi:tRNA1(Val) A37 N6-methylase TrmN6
MMEANHIYLLNKSIQLLQPASGFKTGLDAVMLAASCPVIAKETVLDLGSGVGGVAFCILFRQPDCHITCLENNSEYSQLATENIKLNSAEKNMTVIESDLQSYSPPEKNRRFNHVVCNPPYFDVGHHISSPDPKTADAKGYTSSNIGLEDWVDTAFHSLQPGGSFTMIHQAQALDKILLSYRKRFGAVQVFPLWPKQNRDAKRVVVRALKDRKTPMKLHQGLVLHKADGTYTKEADHVLKTGSRLF